MLSSIFLYKIKISEKNVEIYTIMLYKYINILHKNINILHKELCEILGKNNLHKTKVIFHYRLIIFLL